MKKKSIISVLLCAVMLMAVAFPVGALSKSDCALEPKLEPIPKLVAHRGYSGKYPQNTIPAFEGAIEAGFWGMECDVHTTKDGKWVIIHDDEISNLTNGSGYVKDMTFDELMEFRMDSGNGIENYGTLPIPTLEEYLELFEGEEIVPVIELKTCDTKYFPSLKETLDSYGLSDKAVIISFNKGYLKSYRELDPEIEMLFLSHEVNDEAIDFCLEYNCGINYNFQNFLKCFFSILKAKSKGLTVAAWTVDSMVVTFVLTLFGADIVTSNKITPKVNKIITLF